MTPFDSLKSETYRLIYIMLHQITTTLVNHALYIYHEQREIQVFFYKLNFSGHLQGISSD